MSGNRSSVALYAGVAIALLLLLGLTIALASVDLGPYNLVVALAIAGVKASLVVLFFMHLRNARSLLRIVALAGVVWLMFMVILTLSDILSRA